MTPVEWIVVLGGAALVAFELWFFLGGLPGRNPQRPAVTDRPGSI